MQPSTLLCPHCATRLRIKDRRFIDQPVACPDCGQIVVIVSDRGGELSAEARLEEPAGQTAAKASTSLPWFRSIPDRLKSFASLCQDSRLGRWGSALRSPVGIAWLVAGWMAVLLVVVLWPSATEPHPAGTVSQNAQRQQPSLEASSSERDGNPTEGNDSNKPAPSAPPLPAQGPIEVVMASGTAAGSERAEPPRPPRMAEGHGSANLAEASSRRIVWSGQDGSAVVAPRPEQIRGDTQKGPRVDVEAALKQPIQQYAQTTAVPLQRLLLQIEEMLGLPIRYHDEELDSPSSGLKTKVSVSLERTTVGEILETVLGQAGLSYEVEDDQIRIRSD